MFQKQVIDNSKLTKNFLKNNSHILITKADKGNTTVAMGKNKYILQPSLMLSDNKTYEPLKKDPTNITHNKANNLIKLWREKNYITEKLAQTLKPSNPSQAKFYVLPKIHKPNYPLRPSFPSVEAPLTTWHLFIII